MEDMFKLLFYLGLGIIIISMAFHYYPNQTQTTLEKTGEISSEVGNSAFNIIKAKLAENSSGNVSLNNTLS